MKTLKQQLQEAYLTEVFRELRENRKEMPKQ
jgi:hypothetical protein